MDRQYLEEQAQKLRNAIAFNYAMDAASKHYNKARLAIIEARLENCKKHDDLTSTPQPWEI